MPIDIIHINRNSLRSSIIFKSVKGSRSQTLWEMKTWYNNGCRDFLVSGLSSSPMSPLFVHLVPSFAPSRMDFPVTVPVPTCTFTCGKSLSIQPDVLVIVSLLLLLKGVYVNAHLACSMTSLLISSCPNCKNSLDSLRRLSSVTEGESQAQTCGFPMAGQ